MPKPRTSITWRCGSSCLEVELAQTFTPEAFDTVLARTSERFASTFGLGEATDPTIATLEADMGEH